MGKVHGWRGKHERISKGNSYMSIWGKLAERKIIGATGKHVALSAKELTKF